MIASDDEEDIKALQEDFSFEDKSILDVEESENNDIDGEEITNDENENDYNKLFNFILFTVLLLKGSIDRSLKFCKAIRWSIDRLDIGR